MYEFHTDGELYTATQEDIFGQVQVISRHTISKQFDKQRKYLQLRGFPALSGLSEKVL